MNLEKVTFPHLRNDEHFEFCTHFLNLINLFGPAKLKIQAQFDLWIVLYGQEDEALKKIMKSALTRKIHEADEARDEVFRGLVNANRAALTHFKPAMKEAAVRLQIVLDTYGNVAAKPVDEETSAVSNLLKELMHNHEDDIRLTGLDEWADELLMRNKAVEKLMEDRYRETAERSTLVLRKVRREIDEAYRVITMCIETFSIVETSETAEACKEFIPRLNAIIDRANNLIAQRHGRAEAKKKPDKPATPNEKPAQE